MKLIDLTSQRFGRLTVVERSTVKKGTNAVWRCLCDCGNEAAVTGSGLRNQKTRSCGCLQRDTVGAMSRRHGLGKTPENNIWHGIKTRCYNAKNKHFKNYGARGIGMSLAWRNSFAQFFADMGPRPTPKHSVERIDNDGDYCAENCRWLLLEFQALNRRNTFLLTLNGVTNTPKEWAKTVPVSEWSIRERINNGWTHEEALTVPMRSVRNVNRVWKKNQKSPDEHP